MRELTLSSNEHEHEHELDVTVTPAHEIYKLFQLVGSTGHQLLSNKEEYNEHQYMPHAPKLIRLNLTN